MARRSFLSRAVSIVALAGALTTPLFSLASSVLARAKVIVVPKGARREDLITKNPAHIDPRNLELTPLGEFGTMGLSDHQVRLDQWRLHVSGQVKRPLSLTYRDILGMPPLEKRALLICPGVFSNYGNWKGVSLRCLLKEALFSDSVTHVTVSGPESSFRKAESFEINEVLEDKVFLAYAVNGEYLPVRHGYPLRLVAEGHYGYQWVKYVDHILAEIRNPG